MLPRSDDLTDTSNWWPIAILDIAYKVFAQILHDRIQHLLDAGQSRDQMGPEMGFRRGGSADDAVLVVEAMMDKSGMECANVDGRH